MKQANSCQDSECVREVWHPEHFTCASCTDVHEQSIYYESNGCLYCEKDYDELYAPVLPMIMGPSLIVVAHKTALEEVATSKEYSDVCILVYNGRGVALSTNVYL